MKSLAITLGVALLAIAAFQASADAQPEASRVLDRTVLCSTSTSGGLYEVEARAHAGIHETPSRWKQLPFAVASTGSIGSRLLALSDSLAWITAGSPSAATTIDVEFRMTEARTAGTLALNATACKSSSKTIPLSAQGLRGSAASPFEDEFDCAVPRRVLVRVRATLEAPAELRLSRGFLRTSVPAKEAALAVRTQSGKPLMYATVSQSGMSRLFTGPTCVPD